MIRLEDSDIRNHKNREHGHHIYLKIKGIIKMNFQIIMMIQKKQLQ